MTTISGNTLEGVSATTVWTPHSRVGRRTADQLLEAGRRGRGRRINLVLNRFSAGDDSTNAIATSADEGLALARTIPGVRATHDIALLEFGR